MDGWHSVNRISICFTAPVPAAVGRSHWLLLLSWWTALKMIIHSLLTTFALHTLHLINIYVRMTQHVDTNKMFVLWKLGKFVICLSLSISNSSPESLKKISFKVHLNFTHSLQLSTFMRKHFKSYNFQLFYLIDFNMQYQVSIILHHGLS